MLRYCSDDFVFRDERSQFRMDKLDLRPSLEWDAVLHGKMTYEVIEEGPESAVVLVTESNDFFRLLNLDGLTLGRTSLHLCSQSCTVFSGKRTRR